MGDQRFVLGVDLDGVVADFYGGIRPIAAEWLGVDVSDLTIKPTYGLPEWKLESAGGYKALHRFAVTQRGLFENLIPLPGSPVALRRLSTNDDIRIRIITHRLYISFFHEEAVSQTIRWLDYHGIPYSDLCFMREKAAVGADLYIEDAPGNVRALRSAGSQVIVYANSTNLEVEGPRTDSWDGIEKLVMSTLREWKAKTAI
jgi:5'(3')-deoxyribonucleotidase